MKVLLAILILASAPLGVRAQDAQSVSKAAPSKSVVEYSLHIPAHRWAYGWTLQHFEALNGALALFLSRERGLNTKCLVVPQTVGYAVVWMRSDWEEPISEVVIKKADEIIDSYLSGADCTRISKELKEAKEPNQASEPTAPSGRGSP